MFLYVPMQATINNNINYDINILKLLIPNYINNIRNKYNSTILHKYCRALDFCKLMLYISAMIIQLVKYPNRIKNSTGEK